MSVKRKPNKKEALVRQLIVAMGWDITDENMADTPRRVVSFLEEFSSVERINPAELLEVGFTHDKSATGMIIQKNIPFRGMCSHHLAVFTGLAHIGYIANGKVAGLSKLARVVDAVGTQRPNLQEHITDTIADVIHETLDAKGVIVVTDAEHTCMTCRGVRAIGTTSIMSSIRGIFRDVPAAREEFMSLLSLHRST